MVRLGSPELTESLCTFYFEMAAPGHVPELLQLGFFLLGYSDNLLCRRTGSRLEALFRDRQTSRTLEGEITELLRENS